ncbi:MAG: sulfotransferase, partial [Planctomycetota bacterium]
MVWVGRCRFGILRGLDSFFFSRGDSRSGNAMIAPASLQRPIFIVGTVRSGTTLLAKCLGDHPEICWVHDEGTEMSTTWHTATRVSLGVPRLACEHCLPADATAATDAVREQTRSAFDALFRQERAAGEHRFLGKNPHLWNKLPFLKALFPDAELVVTSRDLRSTVLSTQFLWMRLERQYNVRHYLPPEDDRCFRCVSVANSADLDPARLFPGGKVTVLADYWLRAHEAIERAVASSSRAICVRHRDLVEDAATTLDHLHERLGVKPLGDRLDTEIDVSRNQRWSVLL